MNISKDKIEAVKQSHDLMTVVSSYGVKLQKKGSNYVGLCPFHKEKTPSFTINPKTNLYHCFGCNAGGDVIGFVTKTEGIGFRKAFEKLSGNGKNGKAITPLPSASPLRLRGDKRGVTHSRLLSRVISFYHKSFCEDQRALEYLKTRGITDNSIFSDFQIGYSNGTLLNTIPDEGDILDALKQIGILNDKGHEMFYGSVIFPVFDENKDCVGLYGRRIEDNLKNPPQSPFSKGGNIIIPTLAKGGKGGFESVTHLYLPGPRKGVFNHQAAKRSKSIILTESIIDALTLYNAGVKDVIPCYGVNGLTEDHLSLFQRHQTKEVYICFDRDDAGEQAAEKIKEQLKEKDIDAYIITLPSLSLQDSSVSSYSGLTGVSREELDSPIKSGNDTTEKIDINSFFLSNPDAAAIFERLLKEANPRASIRSDKEIKHEQKFYEKTDSGFTIQYGERRYELKGITKEGVKLKATIKAVSNPPIPPLAKGGEGGFVKHRFHLDTVDLNSNRSRLFFARACAVLFSETEDIVTEDMTRLIDIAEAWQPANTETTPVQKMTKTEEEEALDFLKDTSLFNRILADFETIGLTGEDGNKLMGYIAATSRKLDEPLSVLIQSRSAAGKSTLQDAIIMLIPTEDYIKYTRLTGQALFYKEEDSLVHKLLAIEEEHGARDASYSIRNIQSSKYLSIAATGKDPVTGKLKTEEYKVKGPVALMITTTEVELDYETSNRFITLTIDESKEMTERILQKQRESETLAGLLKKVETEHVAKRHHNAQRLLMPLQVINPYAGHLTYPSESLR